MGECSGQKCFPHSGMVVKETDFSGLASDGFPTLAERFKNSGRALTIASLELSPQYDLVSTDFTLLRISKVRLESLQARQIAILEAFKRQIDQLQISQSEQA